MTRSQINIILADRNSCAIHMHVQTVVRQPQWANWHFALLHSLPIADLWVLQRVKRLLGMTWPNASPLGNEDEEPTRFLEINIWWCVPLWSHEDIWLSAKLGRIGGNESSSATFLKYEVKDARPFLVINIWWCVILSHVEIGPEHNFRTMFFPGRLYASHTCLVLCVHCSQQILKAAICRAPAGPITRCKPFFDLPWKLDSCSLELSGVTGLGVWMERSPA